MNLVETLSRELGHDAVEEANRRYPELANLPAEHVNELVQAIAIRHSAPPVPEINEKHSREDLAEKTSDQAESIISRPLRISLGRRKAGRQRRPRIGLAFFRAGGIHT